MSVELGHVSRPRTRPRPRARARARCFGALAILLAVAACGDHGGGAPPPPAPPIDTAGSAAVGSAVPIAPPPDAAPARWIGVIAAAESVDVAPRAAGVVLSVRVAAGDHVTAGDVLAEMDPAPLEEEQRAAEAALGAASAARRQAEVDVEDARRKVKNETSAVAQGLSPRLNLDDAQFTLKRALAALDKAAASQSAESSRAQIARDHVSDARLKAPFDGTVATRYRDAGNRIEAGTPIVRVVGNGGLRLRFAVPPAMGHLAQVGAHVRATIDTVATPIEATVNQVTPSVDPASGMIVVEAYLPAEGLPAGMQPGLAAWVSPGAGSGQ